MESMRLPPLNYRSLLILYGASTLALLPFAVAYAYAYNHGSWHQSTVLPVFFAAGVAAALLVWARLEPRLLAAQPPALNLNAVASEVLFVSLMATATSVCVF